MGGAGAAGAIEHGVAAETVAGQAAAAAAEGGGAVDVGAARSSAVSQDARPALVLYRHCGAAILINPAPCYIHKKP